MNEVVISCVDLCKSYVAGGLQVDVLQDVNFQITQGESIAIVGASGTGKSTLLHLLGAVDLPSQGQISIAGKDALTLTEADRDNLHNSYLGFVYQFHHLLPEFTALENVAMPLLIAKNSDTQDSLREARKLLQKIGLGKRLQHKPAELSGGERQRTAIARALVTQPKCVLADEPTGDLDEKTAEQIFNLMLELRDDIGTSLVMVTHNLGLAERMDKTYHLHGGSLS